MKQLLIFIFLFLVISAHGQQADADLLVYNAKIYTVDESFNVLEAMVIKDGKLIDLGSSTTLLGKYKAKEKIDAGGKFIYPGFYDAHCHFYNYGLNLTELDLVGTKSFVEVINKVKDYATKKKEGWIIGRGWDQNDWAKKEFPNKNFLDSLFPGRPVYLTRIDGHAALANSAALNLAGISDETIIKGGIVELRNGKTTGILVDNAMEYVQNVIPKPTNSDKVTALKTAEENCLKHGLTTVSDAGLDKEIVFLIDSLQKKNILKIKIYAMLSDNKENLDHFLKIGIYKTQRLTVRSFKFYADGALGSRGACLLKPYADKPDHYGFLLNTPEHFSSGAELMMKHGFQMNTHCIGDSANRLILKIYGNALKGNNDLRWRIEHAQVVDKNDLKYFRDFQVIPSVQPMHAISDMPWAEERLGKDRIKNAYSYKELLEQKGMIASGSDFPVEDVNPLLGFYSAVSRKNLKGEPAKGFLPENALSRQEALKAMTIWAAFSNFEEKERGSLEPGKQADFVITEIDLLACPENQIPSTQILKTFIDGKMVFSR